VSPATTGRPANGNGESRQAGPTKDEARLSVVNIAKLSER
jgi:hypothetical protein